MAFRGNFGDLLLASPKAKSRRHQLFWTGTAVHGHQDHTVLQVGTGHAIQRQTVDALVGGTQQPRYELAEVAVRSDCRRARSA